jgi:hypothetical protein
MGGNIRVGQGRYSFLDPDVIIVLLLLVVVTAALLMPPGPGTPLRAPVSSR